MDEWQFRHFGIYFALHVMDGDIDDHDLSVKCFDTL